MHIFACWFTRWNGPLPDLHQGTKVNPDCWAGHFLYPELAVLYAGVFHMQHRHTLHGAPCRGIDSKPVMPALGACSSKNKRTDNIIKLEVNREITTIDRRRIRNRQFEFDDILPAARLSLLRRECVN